MFKNLTNFSYKRTAKEAVGFYIAWFALIIAGSMAVSFLVSAMLLTDMSTFESGYSLGVKIGTVIAFLSCVFLAFRICKDKGMLNNFKSIVLIVLTGLLAAIGGGLLGLIVPAYLSTRAPHSANQ